MPVISETKHLAPGSECPPLKPGVLRLYSMQFCPFAQRTRLVLAAKDVPHEVVNLTLKEKPAWWTDKYPVGKVPVLELDGKFIPESLVTSDLLEELYPHPALYPTDPWQKAYDKFLVEQFSGCITTWHRLYRALGKGETEKACELSEKSERNIQPFEAELARRGTPYYHGEIPGMLDYMMWPWMERFPRYFGIPALPVSGPPPPPAPQVRHLHQWILRMAEHPTVKRSLISTEHHVLFLQSLFSGEMPDYGMDVSSPVTAGRSKL